MWTDTTAASQYVCHGKGSKMHIVGHGYVPLAFMVCKCFSFPIVVYFNLCFSSLYLRNFWDIEKSQVHRRCSG